MTRLCIVAQNAPMLYGFLAVAFERELEGPERIEIVMDRRRSEPAAVSFGVERRLRPPVLDVLRTQGFVILDGDGNPLAPPGQPTRAEASPSRLLATGWLRPWRRWLPSQRPALSPRARLAAAGGGLVVAVVALGGLGALLTRGTDPEPGPATMTASAPAPVPRQGQPAPAVMPSTPASAAGPPESVAVTAPEPVAATPAPAMTSTPGAPPSPTHVPHASAPAAATPDVTPPPAARSSKLEAAPPEPTSRRTAELRRIDGAAPEASAEATRPATDEAPKAAGPQLVELSSAAEGRASERSITYTARLSDAKGRPLVNAAVSVHGWMPDGSDLNVGLASTSTPGTYVASVTVGPRTPSNLRVRVTHGGKRFEVARVPRSR